MLGKLIKHEFKTTSKMILPLYLVIVVITIFARIAAQSMFSDSAFTETTGFGIFSALTITMYVLGLFAVCIAVFIYLVLRFYKNLFSNEGYLMHTLPVTSWQLLISKLVVSFVWYLIEVALISLSIFCIFANSYVFDSISELFDAYNGFGGLIHFATGMNLPQFWFFAVATLISGLLSGFLLPYASICIGQLWQQHKVAGAFLTYFIIHIILQIVMTIVTAFFVQTTDTSMMTTYIPTRHYGFSLGLNIVLVIVYFCICGFIMKRKINLD